MLTKLQFEPRVEFITALLVENITPLIKVLLYEKQLIQVSNFYLFDVDVLR